MPDKTPPLFGLGTHSHSTFADGYRAWLIARNRRRRDGKMPAMRWLASLPAAVPAAELYLIETVKLFVNLRPHLNPSSAVVISDSPLLLMELPIQPLDWAANGWSYRLQPVDMRAFEERRVKLAAAPTDWTRVGPATIDRLGLVIDEMASGSVLTPLNALLYQLDYAVRHAIQRQLARYLKAELTLRQLDFEINRELTASRANPLLVQRAQAELMSALKTKGALFQAALALVAAKKSIVAFAKANALREYEIKYLSRMLRPPRSKSDAA